MTNVMGLDIKKHTSAFNIIILATAQTHRLSLYFSTSHIMKHLYRRKWLIMGVFLMVALTPFAREVWSARPTVMGHAPQQAQSAPALGHLFMIEGNSYPNHQLVTFDLATRTTQTLFNAPEHSWIYQMDVTANGKEVIFAYSPPPSTRDEAHQPYDRSHLYTLSLTTSPITPTLLLAASTTNEYLFNPVWSADRQTVFYVSYRYLTTADQTTPALDVALYHYDLKQKKKHLVAQDGIWPRLSPNGDQLVYIQVEPQSSTRGIHLQDLATNRVVELVPINHFFDIDTPHFSSNGEWVYFTAVSHSTTISRTWYEKLLNIQVAYAHTNHNIPANWWRVSVDGSILEQVTSTPQIINYGAFNSSGQTLFFTTDTGVYEMDVSQTTITQLPLDNTYRFLTWTK